VWFIFGSLVNVALASGALWAAVPYALVALTVVRILPVMASLFRSGVSARDAFVLGWLGPRGMGSIVFGLLAYIGLSTPQNDTVADVMVATVALSVVLHGLTAGPIGAWYGRSGGTNAIPQG
jgi:NhaP-type Na+/H+ or K+/H+ antiporter